MTLGLERGTVRVVAYDAEWPALYAAEAARVAAALDEAGARVTLEHSGSTAVPGLVAKPIIDILAGLHDERDRAAAIVAIRGAGFDHRGESGIPGRDFFRRGEPRQYHLHLVAIGSAFWDDHRTFRDWLRARPEAAREYAALKQRLAARFPNDREAYIEGKTEHVLAALREARSHTTTGMTSRSPKHALPANRSIPDCAVIPVLGYPDVAAAVAWLRDTFGFVERLRIGDHRCQLTFGNGALIVAQRDDYRDASDSHLVMIRVADADAVCARAEHAGARVVSRPSDNPFGERQCAVEDPWGHRFTLTQTTADVHPADWGGTLL